MFEFDLTGKENNTPNTELQKTCPKCNSSKFETNTSVSGLAKKCLDCNYIPAVGGLSSMVLMSEKEIQDFHNLLVEARDTSEFDDMCSYDGNCY